MKMKKKFQVTITETDEGIEISFIDHETKRRADLGKIDEKTTVGIMCKFVCIQIQRGIGIADLVIPDEKP